MKPLSDICRNFKTDEQYFSSLLSNDLKTLSDTSSVRFLEERVGAPLSGVFVEFVRGFGRGYLADEIVRCDRAISEFDAIYSAERSAVATRMRVYRTLVVASSFALVILFI